MKRYPEDKQSCETDWLLEDDITRLRERSFNQSLQVSRSRRIRWQVVKVVPIVLLLIGWIVYEQDWLPRSGHQPSISKLSSESQSHASLVRVPESAPKIRILTDSEFEEMIQGYPLAIIRQNGQNRYLPLDRSDEH